MIIDPKRDGAEVFYSGKLRNVVGHPVDVFDWIVELICDEDYEDNIVFDEDMVIEYKGRKMEQLTIPYIDVKVIGMVYVDLFNQYGMLYEKLDIERVNV